MPLLSSSTRTLRLTHARWALLAALASACGPDAATPVPQPPAAIAPESVSLAKVSPASSGVQLYGAQGGAEPGAIVRVMNLDGSGPAVATTAEPDGSFGLSIEANSGDELRFQLVTPAGRSQPTDLLLGDGQLTPVERLPCLRVEPGLALEVKGMSAQLRLVNDCSEDASLTNYSFRQGLPDFQVVPEALLARGAELSLRVAFTRTAGGLREDVLFFDASVGGSQARYAITVTATDGVD